MKKTIVTLVAAATIFAAAAPVVTVVASETTAAHNLNNAYTVADYTAAQAKADAAKEVVNKQKDAIKKLKAEALTLDAKINTKENEINQANELVTKYAAIKDTADGKALYEKAVQDAATLNNEVAQLRLDKVVKATELQAAELRLLELEKQAASLQAEADRIKSLIGKPKTNNGVAPTGNPTTAGQPNTAGQNEKKDAPAPAATGTGAKTLPKTSAVK